jgi:hypothetical protein
MSKTEKTAAVKSSLDTRVRAIAESGKGKGMPNWFNLPQNKDKRATHIEVCTKLAELSKKNGNYPITYLVYFAVGKNAHRIPTFLSGYTKIDEAKAEKMRVASEKYGWIPVSMKNDWKTIYGDSVQKAN